MKVADVLLEDFDAEMAGTRKTLERVPLEQSAFKCHGKSMAMGRLAMHVATLPQLGTTILTTDQCDLRTFKFPSFELVSIADMLAQFDAGSAALRSLLAGATDEQLGQIWKMTMGEMPIASGRRSQIYRSLFLNHLIHHRAQLGVYLRLNDLPVPPLYGPSADEQF